jgi:organic radical activating enzyme
MNRTDKEFKEYLDNFSPSFCGAKWYNATVWLGSGMTTSCHHPLPHKIDVDAVKLNPKLLHNTPEKKQQRKQMQCGERPSGCEYCWKIEDMGKDYISDRVYKSNIYSDNELELAYKANPDDDINLHTLEIAFDRTCNFACSYCNPAFSSTWVKDIKDNGGYESLISDGRNHFTHTHDSNQLYKFNETNPYVEAFFKWWGTDLHRTLRELRITGGEPIMSGDLWRLFDWFKHNVDKSQTRLAINSNLGGKADLIQRICDARKWLPSLDVYTSAEAIGEQQDYIRDGMDFDLWWNNLCMLHEADIDTHCMMTINALCLPTLPDLINRILDQRKIYGKNFAVFSLNILRFPSFQSCLVLPVSIKKECIDRLKQIDLDRCHQFEQGQVTRLIEYLQTVQTPHSEAFEMPKLHNDFKHFFAQYDKRRGKSFVDTFPKLADWYLGL